MPSRNCAVTVRLYKISDPDFKFYYTLQQIKGKESEIL